MKNLYSEDLQVFNGIVNDIMREEISFKTAWGKQAKRAVSFLNGDQTNGEIGGPTWVENDPAVVGQKNRKNAYKQNEIEPIVRTLLSYMTRAKPSIEVFPESRDQQAKNIALISQKIIEAKYDIDNEMKNSQEAALWALCVGDVFAKDYWDVNKGHYVDNGNGIPSKTGNNAVKILTPFSITLDNTVTDFDDQPYIFEQYLMDVDLARAAFDQQEEGFTGNAGKIADDQLSWEMLNMLEDMKFSIPNMGYKSGQASRKDKCLVLECFIRPNIEFPYGRFLIKAGNQWVYVSPNSEGSPYYMPYEETMWHPYTHFQYEPYLGRFWGKALVPMLIPSQVRLNEINGAILENANTLAKPNIIAAKGQIKKGIFSGSGARIYEFEPDPSGFVPQFASGSPLPQQFFEEKQGLIETMVRIAATNFVMQGGAPKGVTAASAIDTLLENANTQHSSAMNSFEKFHEQRYTKKLRIIKKFGNYPDRDLEKYLRTFCRDALENEIKDFVASVDLSDGQVLRIEAGSMIPKSETSKRQMYTDFAEKGLLGAVQDPTPAGAKLRNELLERFGEKPFETEESIELKKARWENERIRLNEPVEVSEFDKHGIHISCHKQRAQDPKFLETAPDDEKVRLYDHIKAHMKMEQAEQMQAQMMNPGDAPQTSQGMPADGAVPEAGEQPPTV